MRRRQSPCTGRAMILVCGHIREPVTELVCARLEAEGLGYRVLSPDASPDPGSQTTVHAQWCDGELRDFHISGPDWRLGGDELTGVYFRPVQAPNTSLPGLSAEAA